MAPTWGASHLAAELCLDLDEVGLMFNQGVR
jgi:hypothetical protein